jgi:hypothetical protein
MAKIVPRSWESGKCLNPHLSRVWRNSQSEESPQRRRATRGDVMLELLEREQRLTVNQWKVVFAVILGLASPLVVEFSGRSAV